MKKLLFLVPSVLLVSAVAQKKDAEYPIKNSHTTGLKWRCVGPAVASGRISDIAVNDKKPGEYFLAIASGGIYRTRNWGTTYEPVFENYGSYSMGCITIDPNNPSVIWAGTGENNNQRSVAFGDGIYKSEDGGNSWHHMGLKESEHIHKIIVHPTNSSIVYVASAGPLWKDGGERGVFKTEDGGKTWNRVLHISDMTGVSDLIMDPRDPNVLYAAAHQRRRHVWTYIGGGPESSLYKTTDGGKSWNKINSGLPTVDLGRIGLAISPANPEYLYAIVEAAKGEGGFYRSLNRGASWEQRSGFSTSGNYYQEIICHPSDPNIVFVMDTWLHHSEDGGLTVKRTGEKDKHVDNHCIWINPSNTDHWLVGCDGGLYETWDFGKTYQFKPNLPITQYYRVTVDEALPFYNIYGGTQDNNSMGGPSRTTSLNGIVNSDWFITNEGDGFESAVDPKDPNIVYAQAQYGSLVRYDKKSGEKTFIQPQPDKDEPAYRWNWDAPLFVSPHNNKRLYFAANKVFRSDDRGDNWKTISPDLSRQIDRNTIPVMGRVWSVDAVMKNQSTSIYGNIMALDESPLQEGLLYAGTDDGLIQVSDNGGDSWKKTSMPKGHPEQAYVPQIVASQHDAGAVFAVFNNHKNGDFKPYLMKSTDKGKSWTPISGDLPERGPVHTIAEDHVNKELLFCGTEFGIYFSINGGKNWVKLGSGLPTIAVKDIAVQRRENDLVLATFGRGFYVLDDYSPLRTLTPEMLNRDVMIFPIKKAVAFIENSPLGEYASQGASYYSAPNPKPGAVFTYYLRNDLKTVKEIRQGKENALQKEGKNTPYPTFDEMRAEDREQEPYLLFVVADENGLPVRKIKQSASAGLHRVIWDFRTHTSSPVTLNKRKPGAWESDDVGQLILPGTYQLSIYAVEDGLARTLHPAVKFEVEFLNNHAIPQNDRGHLKDFLGKVSELRRRVTGAGALYSETKNRLEHIKVAVQQVPVLPLELLTKIKEYEEHLYTFSIAMWGDRSLANREFETKDGIAGNVETIVWMQWFNQSSPTGTSKKLYDNALINFEGAILHLHKAVDGAADLEKRLDSYGVPYTPGRDSKWRDD